MATSTSTDDSRATLPREARQIQEAISFLQKYSIDTDELSVAEIIEKMDKIQSFRKTAVQVLSRGQVVDGINQMLKKVPKGYRGEFKRERDLDVSRAKALGWEIFIDDTVKSATGSADGKVRLGDCILMTMPEERYIAHTIARQERIIERRKLRDPKHGKIDQGEADPLVPIIRL